MKVFTIIITYNGMKWIDQCLKSVVNQSEVVVVDNNSSDETANYIKENFTSVNILPQTINHGFGIANNIGINYALKNGADAVFLLNQDAFAQTDCVKNLIIASQQNQDYGILSPIHLNDDGSGVDYSFLKVTSPFHTSDLISDLIVRNFKKTIYEISFINAAAWLIPKEVFYKVGGFDPLFFLYGEDDNYCQRILYHGYKIGIIPNATIYHDSNNSNYQIGEAGSEKYFRQFVNNVNVKYANVNTMNYKQVNMFRYYILKKAFLNLISFKRAKAKLLFDKYKRVDVDSIQKSVIINKKKGSHYLEI
jgi:GT2 family glycosyltransferase